MKRIPPYNKYKWPLCVIGIAVLWNILFPIWADRMMASPLDFPISIDPPGKIEQQIKIVNPENYQLNLVFERSVPFERLKSLIGAMGVCQINEPCSKGVPILVRWAVQNSETGSIISSGEVQSVNSYAWSGASVTRRVTDIKVDKGQYIFKAEIPHAVHEFSDINTHIKMEIGPKSGSTWQTGVSGFGSLFITAISYIAGVWASSVLLFRLCKALLKIK